MRSAKSEVKGKVGSEVRRICKAAVAVAMAVCMCGCGSAANTSGSAGAAGYASGDSDQGAAGSDGAAGYATGDPGLTDSGGQTSTALDDPLTDSVGQSAGTTDEAGTTGETGTAEGEGAANASGSAGAAGYATGDSDTDLPYDPASLPAPTVPMRTAAEVIGSIETGWSLGNTLDSINCGLNNEIGWGNPKTKPEMIDAIAGSGFNTLRVPVSWGEHMGSEENGYPVLATYMDRVQEVVDYGINDGMYVILNCHHEHDTWLIPGDDHIESAERQFRALWSQIAERFADYDDHLIFEGMNECRTIGSPKEWQGGTAGGRKHINTLNRAFLDTVRHSGGNNSERTCLITTYGHNDGDAALSDLWLPVGDDYVGVATHNYNPWNFCAGGGYATWDGSHEGEIDSMFKRLDRYVLQKGFPAIITEYGACPKPLSDDSDELNTAEVVKWAEYYTAEGKEYGIPCLLWDNGYNGTSGERFGYLDRRTCTWNYPEIMNAVLGVYGHSIPEQYLPGAGDTVIEKKDAGEQKASKPETAEQKASKSETAEQKASKPPVVTEGTSDFTPGSMIGTAVSNRYLVDMGYDVGSTYIDVDIAAQHVYYVHDGVVKAESDCVTGNTGAGINTPTGRFKIANKAHDITLKGPTWSDPVKYWIGWSKAYGLHDASWRSEFGGDIYKTDGSHGCVNLPDLMAEYIYNDCPIGTIIAVH